MVTILKLIITLFSLITSMVAWAWPPLFGPEFTFTNENISNDFLKYKTKPTFFYDSLKNPASLTALKEWKNEIEKLCKTRQDCRVEKTSDKHGVAYKVIYDDGFWFQITLDQGVIEVQTSPETLETFERLKNRINDDVFELAKKINLTPHWIDGAGHLNMGLTSTFDNDPVLFRNWLVDQANNPELFKGILGKDIHNAPTLTDLGEDQIKAFNKIIYEFDQNPTDIVRLAGRIKDEVYTFHPRGWNPKNYQNLNLNSITPNTREQLQRVEIRAVRPQESFSDFTLQIKLLQQRVKYLKTLREPLALKVPTNPNVTFSDLAHKFYNYVDEMGESFETYSPLIKSKLYGYDPSIMQNLENLSKTVIHNNKNKPPCATSFASLIK